jgi:hypothetical protein
VTCRCVWARVLGGRCAFPDSGGGTSASCRGRRPTHQLPRVGALERHLGLPRHLPLPERHLVLALVVLHHARGCVRALRACETGERPRRRGGGRGEGWGSQAQAQSRAPAGSGRPAGGCTAPPTDLALAHAQAVIDAQHLRGAMASVASKPRVCSAPGGRRRVAPARRARGGDQLPAAPALAPPPPFPSTASGGTLDAAFTSPGAHHL